jgi:hypothetical protein
VNPYATCARDVDALRRRVELLEMELRRERLAREAAQEAAARAWRFAAWGGARRVTAGTRHEK